MGPAQVSYRGGIFSVQLTRAGQPWGHAPGSGSAVGRQRRSYWLPGSKPGMGGDLGRDDLPNGGDVLEPKGHLFAGARIKDREGHGNLRVSIAASLQVARPSVIHRTQCFCLRRTAIQLRRSFFLRSGARRPGSQKRGGSRDRLTLSTRCGVAGAAQVIKRLRPCLDRAQLSRESAQSTSNHPLAVIHCGPGRCATMSAPNQRASFSTRLLPLAVFPTIRCKPNGPKP